MIDNAALRQFILQHFSDEELLTLCFDYFPDAYGDFGSGLSLNRKAINLIAHCDRRGRRDGLHAALERERPEMWRRSFGVLPVETDRPPVSTPTILTRNQRQVFISHATANADFAHQLAADLRAESWSVWIAPESILPGEKWAEAIDRGLETSGVFVVALTPDAVTSRWVRTETNAAIALEHKSKIRFLPLDLAECDLPVLWSGYQYVTFQRSYEAGLDELLRWLDGTSAGRPQKPSFSEETRFLDRRTLIGQTLNKRYRLDALLGDGGIGTVYRAADLNLERQVAIKLMHSHFARQEEFRARLVQEARTSAQLDHPSIVRVYDFGDSELGLFIAMEYVDGGSLRDHLRRMQRLQKYLPLAQCLQISIQIAEALDYAHRRKIIHRDVEPGNIILKRLSRPDEAGAQPFRALLTDFGLVKLQEEMSLTLSGAAVGTPTHMSPEQCEGRELDSRSDLYSLGVVLYELVANKLPFTFQTLSEAIAAHHNNVQPASSSSYRPEVPPIIDSLLARAMAKSPEQRFGTAAEMAGALRSAFVALEGLPTRTTLRQELNIRDQLAEPPVGFELQIQTPGHPDSIVPLIQSVVTFGRNMDNDIVLPNDGVSRYHTKLQATSLGWEVVDLGGVNGTWLNERRLRPEEATPLTIGSVLRIGPYKMMLQGPESPVILAEN